VTWLTAVLDQLEADAGVQPHLTVRADNLVVRRGDQVVLEHRAARDPRGAPVHLRIRATAVVRAALALAADPIRRRDLTGKLAAERGAPPVTVDRVVVELVSSRLLVANMRIHHHDPAP
jgi:hypothetical protein